MCVGRATEGKWDRKNERKKIGERQTERGMRVVIGTKWVSITTHEVAFLIK